MAQKKIRMTLLVGGESAEHAVSLESGKNVADALDSERYELHIIAIDKKGVMRLLPDVSALSKTDVARPIDVESIGTEVFIVPGQNRTAQIMELNSGKMRATIDVVFPILHGPYGEDGTMQGYLRLLGLPYVGSGVLASAVGMDKEATKCLLRDAGLPIPNFIAIKRHEVKSHDFNFIKNKLGLPFFLKPANMGSSVGVHKCNSEDSFHKALKDAFQYDTKVMVEEFIQGREIECAILGNKDLIVSVPGEVIPQHEFYSYDAKYLDENGAKLEVPAKLEASLISKIQNLAMQVYKAIGAEGMSRIDFFLKSNGNILVNEINTIPGFTKISMYPIMLNHTGVAYYKIIDRLVELAFERNKEERELKK